MKLSVCKAWAVSNHTDNRANYKILRMVWGLTQLNLVNENVDLRVPAQTQSTSGLHNIQIQQETGHACAKSTCSLVVISQLPQRRILPTLPQTSSIAQQPSSLTNLLVWCPFTYSTQTGVTVRGRNRNSIRAGHHRPLTLPSNHFTGACHQTHSAL